MQVLLKKKNKTILIVVAAVILVVASIGGTLAWLTSTPNALVNTFEVGKVPNQVVETFDKTTKSNVKVQNIGNVPAFIRATLVPVWRNSDGSGTGLATDGTYTISINSADWTKGSDGYYYHNAIVQPGVALDTGNLTAVLVQSCTPNVTGLSEAYNGKYFELQVLAQSIQAEGMGTATAQAAFARATSSTTTTP